MSLLSKPQHHLLHIQPTTGQSIQEIKEKVNLKTQKIIANEIKKIHSITLSKKIRKRVENSELAHGI
jgi:predicted DNA-binding protein YlxM (UPF0122 family)